MHKDEVIAVLKEMADLLEITDANPFEVMAYRNGAASLADWFGDLDECAANGTLTEIPSIGKGLSQVITELVRSGTAAELARVRGLVPPGLPTLLRVRGLGPKRVRALWRELDVASPDDLRRAADQGRVQALRGFGSKTVEKILADIKYLEEPRTRPARSDAAAIEMPRAPQATGRILAGTSGYSYPKWKGSFYPADARADDFLAHYSKQLATVEINNTFYHFPSEKVIEEWRSQVPEGFRFAVKAHRRITHQMRLSAAAHDHIVDFVERCGQLGERLGCVLFQLPPDFRRDDARLDMLLAAMPAGPRFALEFRHESWLVSEVLDKLRAKNIACVAGDSEDQSPRQVVTADFIYARLRRPSYSAGELDAWDEWFSAQRAEKRDVLMYLKHDDTGDAPREVVARWSPAKAAAAREALKETLARPARKSPARRRKSG